MKKNIYINQTTNAIYIYTMEHQICEYAWKEIRRAR